MRFSLTASRMTSSPRGRQPRSTKEDASTVVPKPAKLPIITGQRKGASRMATAGGGDGGLLAWTLGLTMRSQGLPAK
ncbi:hypothetical protein CGCSCA4_v012539 [Colletotrichum siamense]|uniref:Uncharacterized protein n=1 Tax=Colletotrichum siamense TaxID=690259 RepID=A0A9P5BMZ6_COLSI|nr:hypothetical protein CGCSCA4_v012539 [Colletotrichum siamense]KAF4845571.1 hypothetical protein CGCSCA2_v013542 [Colletotrichum siamense]